MVVILTIGWCVYDRHSFGEQFSHRKWAREVAGQREILSAYGGVKLEDVRGMRAPFLSVSIDLFYIYILYTYIARWRQINQSPFSAQLGKLQI